jgi:hypothetical protein
MNENTYHISSKKPAEAEAFNAGIYPESVLKVVWRRIRKPSRKTILKLLTAPDFAVLRAAELTLSHGYRYFCIFNEAAGYAITNANGSAKGNMVFGNSYTTCAPSLSIPLFKPESELMIRCFNERPASSFALDAQFISAFDSREVTTGELPKKQHTNGAERAKRNNFIR